MMERDENGDLLKTKSDDAGCSSWAIFIRDQRTYKGRLGVLPLAVLVDVSKPPNTEHDSLS